LGERSKIERNCATYSPILMKFYILLFFTLSLVSSLTLKSQETEALPIFNYPDTGNPCSEENIKNTTDIYRYSSDLNWKLAALEQLIYCSRQDWALRYEKLQILNELQKFDLALIELDSIDVIKKNDPSLKLMKAELLIKTDRAENAMVILDDIINENTEPYIGEALYLKALLYCRDPQKEIEACSYFEKAIANGKVAENADLRKCGCRE